MALSHVTNEDAARRLAQRAIVAPDSQEGLSDVIRAEVHARKQAPRAMTLARVARLLAPAIVVQAERLDEVCDALEREGDLVLGPGGVLHATPTRVVTLHKAARVFSSLPTHALATALSREITATNAARSVASADGLAVAVASIRGVMVSPETWAGVDQTPSADATFLSTLEQRLEWQAVRGGALEKDGPLDWRTWQVTAEGAGWRRCLEGRLWWARTRSGGHQRAWTTGASPSTSQFIVLSPDDADRARFALSRGAPTASKLRIERADKRVILEVPGWLPRPEYRWLSLHAKRALESNGTRWEISADDEAQVVKLLLDRLGLVAEVG